jgi:ParB family transcriptional regulator, chromosome partitioning protein
MYYWRWLILQIVYRKISDLKKYEKNNKKHPEKQLEKIVASIKEYGFKNPVLIDKNNEIIAGHGRTLAAERIGMQEVPCIDCSDLNAKQVKALRLMDNKSAELAEWDFDNIKAELEELKLEEFDIDLTGFEMADISGVEDSEEYGTEFSLPDGDKAPFQQMTFTLADSQAEFIKEAIRKIKEEKPIIETFGNENSNGNALYGVVLQWEELKR